MDDYLKRRRSTKRSPLSKQFSHHTRTARILISAHLHPSKMSIQLPTLFSILSAIAFSFLPSSYSWIFIILMAVTTFLMEYLCLSIACPGQDSTFRTWFGNWCLRSSSLLLCLKLFLGVLLAIQGYLELITVAILKSLQLYQLILLGLMGWIILQGPRIYRIFGSRVMGTVTEVKVTTQDTDAALVGKWSLLKSPKSTQMDASISQIKSHTVRQTNLDENFIRSSPRLATVPSMNELQMARKTRWRMP